MDWKIILILIVLIGIVLVICWYSCPSRENYKIPWRPKGDSYKAPNVGFTDSHGNALGVVPYTGCSHTNEFSIYWVCDYSTTIYNPDSIHFNLTTIVTLSGGPTAPTSIAGDISPSDLDMNDTSKPYVYYKYTYHFDEGGIFHPGNYVLYLNSFVHQRENVPKGQKSDSDITEGSMVIYDSQETKVKNITIRDDDDDVTDEFYVGQDIIVKWEARDPSFPPQGVTYTVSLMKDTGEESNIVPGITDTSYKYSNINPGNYIAVVKTINEDCNTMTNGSSSGPFNIEMYVPAPTIVRDGSSCTYAPDMKICDIDNILTIHWCVDFSGSYKPSAGDDPNFLINVTGDANDDRELTDVVEDDNDRNIYHYSYAFGRADPGIYNIKVTTKLYDQLSEGSDSDSSLYTIYPYSAGYHARNLIYDRDLPVYSVNDTMTVSWDPPDTTDLYPVPIFNYTVYFDWGVYGSQGCGTCQKSHATFTLESGAAKICTCTERKVSMFPGDHTFSVKTGIAGCNEGTEWAHSLVQGPNFTVVDCLDNNDCGDLFCDTSRDGGTCVGCVEDSQCSGEKVCIDDTCVQCRDDTQCSGATPKCDVNSNRCVTCLTDNDCAGNKLGDTCVSGGCICKNAGGGCNGDNSKCNTSTGWCDCASTNISCSKPSASGFCCCSYIYTKNGQPAGTISNGSSACAATHPGHPNTTTLCKSCNADMASQCTSTFCSS